MSKHKKFSVEDVMNYVWDGNDSELSDLSEEEIEDEADFELNCVDEQECTNDKSESESDSNESDDDDNFPLIQLAGNRSDSQNIIEKSVNHHYRWRSRDAPVAPYIFENNFTDPPDEPYTPTQYFFQFLTEEAIQLMVDNTNLYSVQKTGKSVNVTVEEMKSFIGMQIVMGIVRMPRYEYYWSRELRYPAVADVMPLKRFEQLRRFLHVVDNDTFDEHSSNKLFKIQPLIDLVRKECIKVEPEEFHSIDEQIIPCKTKRSKIRQYNPKKPHKWGFKNLVRAGASGLMYDFYLYAGKEEVLDNEFTGLQKCAIAVARLCKHLPNHKHHKLYFDNWFTTLPLLQFLKMKGIHAAGTIRMNRIKCCPLQANKDLEKLGRGALDYRTDSNSGLVVAKWLDNKVVLVASNYIGIEPMGTISRWDKSENKHKDIQCPSIVLSYNKSMGGVDLVDMLISLYRIKVKTKRWYIKVLWHLIDICKVNAWNLYRRHFAQLNLPKQKMLSLCQFSTQLGQALMYSNKFFAGSQRGRPSKRASSASIKPSKRATVATPCQDVRYDNIAHWPEPVDQKQRCRNCQAYSRTKCTKCKLALCLVKDRNCFQDFHTK